MFKKSKYLGLLRPIKRKSDTFFAFIKIGGGRKLLLFDLAIIAIVLYDANRLYRLNLDLFHFSFLRRIWEAITLPYVAIAGALIFVPPALSAFANFLFRDTKTFRERTIPLTLRGPILAAHFVVSITFVFIVSISHELQILSGVKASASTSGIILSSYEYAPLYSSIYLKLLAGGGVFVLVVRSIISGYPNKKEFVPEFKLWFRLSDTASDYFPKQKSELIFANTASMAPSINWIVNREEFHRHNYQVRVPTSDDAKNYLTKAAEESRQLLCDYLFQEVEPASRSKYSIEFLPGTSRGLEVGLTQIENLKTIVVSPYEHPSQLKVIEWFVNLNPHVTYVNLNMDYSKLRANWEEQKKWLIESIRSAILEHDQGKTAILLSDVHYMTGLIIKVTEIMKALRPEYENSNLVFMVDGSQSVGNLLKPFDVKGLHGQDFFYFSAHKWLLSPNTCGVLIGQVNPDRYHIYPYDLFGDKPPSATIDPGVIFGIRSSLEYLMAKRMLRLRKFHEKSSLLKSYFIEKISDRFEVVESKSPDMNESIFVAIRPRSGNRWKEQTKQEFWAEITQDAVDLSLIELAGDQPDAWWLRVSFPYFLQLHQLKQLVKHLKARLKRIN